MAKVGYLMRSAHYDGAEPDIEWMKNYGCCEIVEENPEQEKLRPLWNKVLGNLRKGDELVVPKLSNVLQGTRQLAFFLEFCRVKVIRLISIHDKIDSGNELFPETKTSDILQTIALLPVEVNANRKSGNHIRQLKNKIKVLTSASHTKAERTKLVVNMYKSGHTIDDIWKTSGFKSRSSIFRILNAVGVDLNRGHTKGRSAQERTKKNLKKTKMLKKIKITVIRKVNHTDLSALYENPMEHTCDMQEGQTFISEDNQKPEGMCESAWQSIMPFVMTLAYGGGDFYNGWMKNPYSAMISCNDGFRPVSFLIETIE